MVERSTALLRGGLIGLAALASLAATAGSATAQYYYDDGYRYPPAEIDGYGPRYGYGYGYGYREDDGYLYRPAPRRRLPAAVTAEEIGRLAYERHGLTRIDRLTRSGDAYIVEGARADGRRQRLVLDAYAGDLIRRQTLSSPRPPDPARAAPQENARPKAVPAPPQRPAQIEAPGSPPPPAAPAQPPVPQQNAAPPPQAAPVAPPQPQPQPAAPPSAPQTGTEPPKPVNPQDVRPPQWSQPKPGAAAPQDGANAQPAPPKPPESTTAPSPAPAAPGASTIPPVQGQDETSSRPRVETVIPPVTPTE